MVLVSEKKNYKTYFWFLEEKKNVVFALCFFFFFLEGKKIKKRKKIYLALWFSFLDTRRRTTVDKETPNKQLGLLEIPL